MAPVIVIHNLAHARAALAAAAEAGVPVTLISAPAAAAYLGAAVFREIVATARREVPGAEATAVLDCGDARGLALNALRHGLKAVCLKAPADVLARVADIARQLDAVVLERVEGPALDLLDAADPLAACRQWLANSGPRKSL